MKLPRGRVGMVTPQSFSLLHIGGTEQLLAGYHVRFEHLFDGSIRIQPANVSGVFLEFAAA